jgi:hypothetical protein
MSLALRCATIQAGDSVGTIAWGRRLLPILIIQGYLWLTLALYAFSPWPWPMRDPGKLYGFVIACHAALLFGYLAFAHRPARASAFAERPIKLVQMAIWASLIAIPVASYARTGNWIPDIIGSLANPGQAYFDAHSFAGQGTNAGAYLRILVSPLVVLLFPVAVFYWSHLSRAMKAVVAAIGLAVILVSISTGQRRDIADLLVTLPLVIAASHWAKVTQVQPATRRLIFLTVLAAIAAFLAYFAYSHVSRVGADTAAYAVNPATQQHPNRDNPILRAIPEEAHPGFLAFANYLTTGYYGLSLSLDREQEQEWMYGVGHSMFLTRNVARFTNNEKLEAQSLPLIISEKDGFKYGVYWCTAYPFFLNDLGQLGTIALMFACGALLAITWIDMLSGRSPYAVVMFWLITILIFYLPATNRMLQDGEGVAAFYIWLFVYLRGRMGRKEVRKA